MDFKSCLSDASFGPFVKGCRGNFDFTLKFELIIFFIAPYCVFTTLVFVRILILVSKSQIITGNHIPLGVLKNIVNAVYFAFRIIILILSPIGSPNNALSHLFISAQALGLVASVATAVLSYYEHWYSRRPSILLSTYLCSSLLLDIAHDRTLWLNAFSSLETGYSSVFSVAVAIKAFSTWLESRPQSEPDWDSSDVKEIQDSTSGVYSLSSFMWLGGLLLLGYKKVLALSDLPTLDGDMLGALYERFRKYSSTHLVTKHQTQRNGRYTLLQALSKALAMHLLLPVLPRVALIGLSLAQAFLTQAILRYLEEDQPHNYSWGLIGATVLIYGGICICTSLYWYFHERLLCVVRGCLASAIFHKTLDLSLTNTDRTASVTLMSTDLDRIHKGFLNLHELWANVIEAGLAAWFLWRQVGIAFIAPVGLVLLSFLGVFALGQYVGVYQRVWMGKIQNRVAITADAISKIKHLKVSGMTLPLEATIQKARESELRASRGIRRLQIASLIIAFAPDLTAPGIMLAATKSQNFTSQKVYTAIALLALLTVPLGSIFRSVSPLMSAFACLQRIQAFLELDTRKDPRLITHSMTDTPSISSGEKINIEPLKAPRGSAIRLVDASFGWQSKGQPCLRNINLTVNYSALTVIIGPVGSGKSTLCKALLGETLFATGKVVLDHDASCRIGYCDQVPFIRNCSIKQNIIGFSRWNPVRYLEVIKASMLLYDLNELPEGDATVVGSGGTTLSGGQKQRIAIARALYLDTRLLILDNVLSGLDTHTEHHLFQYVLSPNGLLKKRENAPAVVFSTHSVKYARWADHIVLLNETGEIIEQGSWEELSVYDSYLQNLCILENVQITDTNQLGDVGSDQPLEQIRPKPRRTPPSRGPDDQDVVNSDTDNSARQNGDMTVYRHYFRAVPLLAIMSFITSSVSYGFFYSFPNIWLKWWLSDSDSTRHDHPKAFWNGIYAMFQIFALLSELLTMYLALTYFALISGAAVHLSALRAVTRAPLYFFAKVDLGTITNYFSQDMTLVDGALPASLIQFASDVAASLGMAGNLASSSPYMAAAYPICFCFLFFVTKFYLRTSRQLRLLDLEAKSPLYKQFLESDNGIATIRAADWTKEYLVQNELLLNVSQRPAYLLAMVQRWLLFILNTFVLLLALLTVVLVTQLKVHGTGFAGAGLISLMQIGQFLTNCVKSYANLEVSMGAVSRLKALSESPHRECAEGQEVVPPLGWPRRGSIEVNEISASYKVQIAHKRGSSYNEQVNEKSLSLRDLRFHIDARQKVAICGRTGSGKSSIILLLLCMLKPLQNTREDAITIDGISIQNVDPSILRERIFAVPQDTIFLPKGASWLENMEPFTTNAAECRSVLEDVNLWDVVVAQGGDLTAAMDSDALSQGQRQLFSLARAVLRKRAKTKLMSGQAQHGGLLLLDEPSSAVDFETEGIMHRIIQREFCDYTVVMITHRLEFITGLHSIGQVGSDSQETFFNRVLVVDAGTIVEDGHPAELLEAKEGRFRALWEASRV
ncbi:fumonisin cluster-ABC transporter [Fusarium fujikuroi]|uniref:ABC transporter n=1 Tax=Fusarium fujikuroi TaxID=5127 RepID=A0A1B1TG92_FUSFU|nr:ABC transporter [Fusarium fujikuroi]SCV45071.1 fumonisin cluster-ABC transporter [Fusarium fujikuroi]